MRTLNFLLSNLYILNLFGESLTRMLVSQQNFFGFTHFLWDLGNRACYDAILEACTAGNRLRSNTLTLLIYFYFIYITAAVLTHFSSRLSESFVPISFYKIDKNIPYINIEILNFVLNIC
jgi:hypothetical protein